MARAKKTAKPTRRISVDMSEVEARVTLPEGDYRLKVADISQEEGANADYLKWKWEVTEGKFKGKNIYDNTSLAPQALWRLANLLTTLGIDVPKGELDLDFDEIIGLEVQGMVEHEDYEGRPQARLSDFYPVDGDAAADDDEDEEEEKPVKKGKKAKPVEDDDDEDEDEKPAKKGKAKAPVEDDDDDEEEAPKRGRGRPAGSKNKPKDDDEDEDEEEDEKPAKKGKGTKPKPPSRQELEDMDADELEDVVQQFDLDVDLDDYRTLRKKIAAVIEALT